MKKFALFDFDGVIADSFSVCMKTARAVCSHITEEEYRSAFEGNIYEKHSELLTRHHGPECHHDLDWFEIYTPMFETEAKIFPGVEEVITHLSHEYVLIVVSSSVHSPIQSLLEKHHLGRYFSEIMGHDVHPLKVEKIKMIFERYNTSADNCVFLTDTLGDMEEAKAAEVGAIGVSWGWHSRETLEKGNPFRIVEMPAEIPQAVSDYFAQKPSFLG